MITHIDPKIIQQITPISKALLSLSPLSSLVSNLDDSVRAEYESLHDLYFSALVASSVAVVIGVVFEEAGDWMTYLKSLLPIDPVTEYWTTKRLAKIGWILIVLGVAGEGIFEVAVSRADNILHDFDTILLTEARKQAGDAAGSAKAAREQSTAAKTEADAARLSSGEALARAHSAERSLAKAESDAGKAQIAAASALTSAIDASTRAGKAEASLGKAEAEAKNAESSASNALTLAREARQEAASFESDLARLKQQAADRVLDEYQQDQVRLRIAPFLGTPYELGVADTPEAENLLAEIDAALGSAGWVYKFSQNKAFRFTKKIHNGHEVDQVSLRGVEIGLSTALWVKLKPAADALAKALNSAGVSAFVVKLPDGDPSPSNIHIMVGTKP
jgi:hypothetical protein